MNTQSIGLLEILAKCNNNDQYLSHELKIQNILKMDSYLELSNREAFSDEYYNLFHESKLRSYDDKKLDIIIDVLPYIPECLENIMYSLRNGACWKLTSADRPKYFDKQSILRLTSMLENSTGKNYCNISANDFMKIFDDSTIKSIKPYFDQLPHCCENYGEAIDLLLAPNSYCISENEIRLLEDEYNRQAQYYLDNIQAGKDAISKENMIKIFVVMACCSIPHLYSLSSGNMSDGVQNFISLLILLLGVFYYKKG